MRQYILFSYFLNGIMTDYYAMIDNTPTSIWYHTIKFIDTYQGIKYFWHFKYTG